MKGQRTTFAKTLRPAACAAVLLIEVFSVCCEKANTNAREWRWREARVFDENASCADLTEAEEGVVFIAGSERVSPGKRRAVIYKFENGSLDTAFTAPAESSFNAVAGNYHFGGYVYAAGWIIEGGDKRPYLVTFDKSDWKEVAVPDWVEGAAFGDLALAYSSGSCWLITRSHVYSYKGGVWRERLNTPDPAYYFDYVAATAKGRVFVSRKYGGSSPVIFVSDDGGVSWAEERPVLESPVYLTSNTDAVAAGGGKLFILADLRYNADSVYNQYRGVLVRNEGPPGGGEYSLSFLAPHGPYVYDLKALAFKSEDYGFATGPLTSLALDDGIWYQEVVPETRPIFYAVAAGVNRFWAVGTYEGRGSAILWQTY